MKPTTRAAAIEAYCRACIVDPQSAGTWREQIAGCTGAGCALFNFRPMPRQCVRNGLPVPTAIAEVRAKLDRLNRAGAECRA